MASIDQGWDEVVEVAPPPPPPPPVDSATIAAGDWLQPFYARTAKSKLQPQYMMLISWYDGPTWDAGTVTDASGYIYIDSSHGFLCQVQDTILVYDAEGWELMEVGSFTEDYLTDQDRLDNLTRSAHNSGQRTHALAAAVMRPWAVLATHDLSGITTLPHFPYMSFPTGHSVELLYQEGRTQFDGVSVEAHDRDGDITRQFAKSTPVGHRAVIIGGYEGLAFAHWSTLYVGTVETVDYRGGVYTFKLTEGIERLNRTIFGQIEDFAGDGTGVATATINSGDTTLTLDDSTNIYPIEEQETDAGYNGWYFRLKDTDSEAIEYIRIDPGGVSTPPTYDLVRAQFGTTALTVTTANQEIRFCLGFHDNPVNILLKLILTLSTEYKRQHATYDLYFGDSPSTGDEGVGAGYPVSDIDVASFEAVRDEWFVNDHWVVLFYKRTRIKEWIEKHILKPLNLNLFINKSGRLSLAALGPPVTGASTVQLTDAHIVGTPEFTVSTDEIINNVTAKYDYDMVEDDEYNTTSILVNATSQSTYNIDRPMTLECKGVNTSEGGSVLAARYARKKVNYFKQPNPLLPVPVLFNAGAYIEPGSVHTVTHDLIPDTRTGRIGFDNEIWVAAKRIDWQRGAIELECLPILWGEGRIGVIGPSGLPDFDNADDDQKRKYVFISDTDGAMGDGSEGYIIY